MSLFGLQLFSAMRNCLYRSSAVIEIVHLVVTTCYKTSTRVHMLHTCAYKENMHTDILLFAFLYPSDIEQFFRVCSWLILFSHDAKQC